MRGEVRLPEGPFEGRVIARGAGSQPRVIYPKSGRSFSDGAGNMAFINI